MAQRKKWITNGVSFARGNHQPLIAKFDNSKMWLDLAACCTTQTFKDRIKSLAEAYGAKVIEVKPMWNEKEELTVDAEELVKFRKLSTGYRFFREKEVPEGATREFIEFEECEVFA